VAVGVLSSVSAVAADQADQFGSRAKCGAYVGESADCGTSPQAATNRESRMAEDWTLIGYLQGLETRATAVVARVARGPRELISGR
jgi:hypothetical protein